MNRKQRGFTLIELLVVVAIVGILAAIAIPNMIGALQRSRQKRTLADMRTIATAWEARAADTGGYAAAGVAVQDAESQEPQPGDEIESVTGDPISETVAGWLQPTYIKSVPVYDGWGVEFRVAQINSEYAILSSGADQTLTPDTWTVGPTNDFDCDIIMSGGHFLMYPDGVQAKETTQSAPTQNVQ